jgi:NADH:ubiquinone oxidoreductase subunit 5 (subunit L)/multisubunit Na+/H+ antiporter MnhA subunit
MGGLIKFLPFTYSVMLTGSLSLLATPFLTGFYSKDLILELAFGQYSFSGMYAYILGSITAGITAFYSFRLISLVFLTTPQGNKESYLNSHESKLAVIVPLLILAIFSIFFGFIFSDLFVGLGTDFFANSVFTHPNNISLVEAEFSLNPIIKLLPAILSLSGAALAIYLYHIQPILLINLKFNCNLNWIGNGNGSENGKAKGYDNYYAYGAYGNNSNSLWPWLSYTSEAANGLTGDQRVNSRDINYIGKSLYTFLNGKYFFDTIYNQYFITNGFKLGYTISKEIDRGAIEFLGPFGLSNYFNNTGKNLAKLDTGIITTYSLYITLGLLALLFLVFAPLFFNNFGNLAFNYNTTAPARAWAYLDEFRLFIIYFASALCVLGRSSETLNNQQANKKE